MSVKMWKFPARRALSVRAISVIVWLLVFALVPNMTAPPTVLELKSLPANRWQLRWNSTAGRDYQHQRARDDQLANPQSINWVPLLTIRATGAVTVAEDAPGAGVKQRFYRIAEITNT